MVASSTAEHAIATSMRVKYAGCWSPAEWAVRVELPSTAEAKAK